MQYFRVILTKQKGAIQLTLLLKHLEKNNQFLKQ